MTKKEAIQILLDRENLIEDFAEVLSERDEYEWIGLILSIITKSVPEAISALEEETK